MKASGGDEQLSIYHERQAAALCGVHSLNTLLQARALGQTRATVCGCSWKSRGRAAGLHAVASLLLAHARVREPR